MTFHFLNCRVKATALFLASFWAGELPSLLVLCLIPSIPSDVEWWWPLDRYISARLNENYGGANLKISFSGCQIQGFSGLLCPDHEDRRIHVHDEGCWRQHSPWCRRSRCPCRFRQVQGALHHVESLKVKTNDIGRSCNLEYWKLCYLLHLNSIFEGLLSTSTSSYLK